MRNDKRKPENNRKVEQRNSNFPELQHLEEEFHHTISSKSFKENNNKNSFTKTGYINIQDAFINKCRHEKILVCISLIDRTEVNGTIAAFDNSTIIVNDKSNNQLLIMKSSVAKIVPHKGINYIFNVEKNPILTNGKVLFDYSGDPRYQM